MAHEPGRSYNHIKLKKIQIEEQKKESKKFNKFMSTVVQKEKLLSEY